MVIKQNLAPNAYVGICLQKEGNSINLALFILKLHLVLVLVLVLAWPGLAWSGSRRAA